MLVYSHNEMHIICHIKKVYNAPSPIGGASQSIVYNDDNVFDLAFDVKIRNVRERCMFNARCLF